MYKKKSALYPPPEGRGFTARFVKTHTKAEFEAMLAEKAGFTKADGKKAVDAFLASITDIIKAGE